ncbi:MAG: hypothetical protein P8Q14_11780 [Vicingaceae bacterium]|nr:hypothetical protein [Vicingaceae bacterium]
MKKLFICLIALISTTATFAQNNTTGSLNEPAISSRSSVLIIPFEAKMYISDIDRDLAQNHQMNFQEIKAKFRAALDREIFIALKNYYNPLSFYSIPPNESRKELGYIYNSIGYKYELVPEEVVVKKENVGTKLIGKFKKKKKEEEYIEAGIQGGQVVSQVDNREKYMKTTLVNEKLLPSLNSKFSASHYIFINQLDIKRGADMRYAASDEGYKREIKVHYTIFDNVGKELSSGAIKSRFSSNENDIDKIIRVQFPLIAERIVKNLIGPDASEVE